MISPDLGMTLCGGSIVHFSEPIERGQGSLSCIFFSDIRIEQEGKKSAQSTYHRILDFALVPHPAFLLSNLMQNAIGMNQSHTWQLLPTTDALRFKRLKVGSIYAWLPAFYCWQPETARSLNRKIDEHPARSDLEW